MRCLIHFHIDMYKHRLNGAGHLEINSKRRNFAFDRHFADWYGICLYGNT